jgi:hypothetical protein
MNIPEIPHHPAYPKCPVRMKILTGPGRSRRHGVEASCLKKKGAGGTCKDEMEHDGNARRVSIPHDSMSGLESQPAAFSPSAATRWIVEVKELGRP